MDKFDLLNSHYIHRYQKANGQSIFLNHPKHTFAFKVVRMEGFTNEDEQELKKALGSPRYFIDTPGKIAGEQYYWFPNAGDSMTDGTARSIPGGSLVLGRLLSINSIQDIPLHRPMVFIIDYGGEQFCLLKSPASIKTNEANPGTELLCLHSYNPAPGYDDLWVPFRYIKYIFLVERVRLRDDSEFIPEDKGK